MLEQPRRATLREMGEEQKTGPSVKTVPPGDDRERLVCPDCGYVAYDNPRIIAGAVSVWQEKILLCRRAIPPRKGFYARCGTHVKRLRNFANKLEQQDVLYVFQTGKIHGHILQRMAIGLDYASFPGKR